MCLGSTFRPVQPSVPQQLLADSKRVNSPFHGITGVNKTCHYFRLTPFNTLMSSTFMYGEISAQLNQQEELGELSVRLCFHDEALT